jgi:hypothetical protein
MEAVLLLAVLRGRLPYLRLRELGRVAIEAIVGTLVAGGIAVGVAVLTERLIGEAPSRLALVGESLMVTVAFGLSYAAVSLVLRIPELASIVEVMVDVIRRPFRT